MIELVRLGRGNTMIILVCLGKLLSWSASSDLGVRKVDRDVSISFAVSVFVPRGEVLIQAKRGSDGDAQQSWSHESPDGNRRR